MGKHRIIIFLIVLVILILLAWLSWPRKISDDKQVHVWKPVTHRFDPEQCAKGRCKVLMRTPSAAGDRFALVSDPAVDDETAQWSDCLSSVAMCVDASGNHNDAGVLKRCVSKSQCPSVCRKRFASVANTMTGSDELWDLFERQFVRKGGICVPGG